MKPFDVYSPHIVIIRTSVYRAGIDQTSGTPKLTPVFSEDRNTPSLVFCVVFSRSLCPVVHFLLTIVLSVFRRCTS